jgi:hypothetical protein
MIRRAAHIFTLCFLSIALLSCKAREAVSVSAEQKSPGPIAVAPEARDGQYTPPADGRLTGAQIENFIKIRQRAKVIESQARQQLEVQAQKPGQKQDALVAVMAGAGPMADLVTADLRAAKDLGLNGPEYEWVKQQMIDASMAAASDKGQILAARAAKEERANLQKSYDTAPDQNSKTIYAGMISDSEKNEKDAAAAVEKQSPSVVYNKELLAKYEDAVRPAMELLLPGTGHEEDIQKAIGKYNAAATAT